MRKPKSTVAGCDRTSSEGGKEFVNTQRHASEPSSETGEVTVTDNQKMELARLKMYFPYRIIWGITKEFQLGASTTKRAINQLVRQGWTGFTI